MQIIKRSGKAGEMRDSMRWAHFPVFLLYLIPTWGLIVIDADPVELQIAVSMVGAGGVNAVLIADHLPELREKNRRGRGRGWGPVFIQTGDDTNNWICWKYTKNTQHNPWNSDYI